MSVRVFLSYAHDDDPHRAAVRELWYFLRRNGIDARCDMDTAQRREWTRWMEHELARVDFVLVIASPAYRSRAEHGARNGSGNGVEYEAALIREMLYADRERWFPRILPVLLPGRAATEVPAFLLPTSSTVYRVDSFTVPGAEQLLRHLTGQQEEPAPALGPVPRLGPRTAPAATAPVGAGPPVQVYAAAPLEVLIGALARLPITQSPMTRAHFTGMIVERLGEPLDIDPSAAPVDYLRALLTALAARPGGMLAVAEVVQQLHSDRPDDVEILGELVYRDEPFGR
ncbi:toll/interleukin-1 receptor domain-containing protein [Actinoplanes teichomyceticus]|uniref:TIR domain-containing protein n=1 Tax=Actinoplanes teichomyceticus TaxID=1867 RepID=A0A561W9X5_ACTTI|nr:toll/interleukin-1 receptor domain-containing protein [Actinoplanes teichomyceticus]TWG20660.1 TIR domain-containing protein [Actinoplanes teichomyceticus]GIF14315.1 hypothetical protein Ate01nite_43470 [Actinoplanes teichomyceticus]